MKIAFTLLLIICSITSFSQSILGLEFAAYKERYMGPNYTYDYISHGNRADSANFKYYCYFKNNGKSILAVFENNLLVKQTTYDNNNLFKIVKKNIGSLKKVMNSYLKFHDTNKKIKKHLAIRLNGLHFNHYEEKSLEFIENLKNEKLKEGFKTINLLIELLEKG